MAELTVPDPCPYCSTTGLKIIHGGVCPRIQAMTYADLPTEVLQRFANSKPLRRPEYDLHKRKENSSD